MSDAIGYTPRVSSETLAGRFELGPERWIAPLGPVCEGKQRVGPGRRKVAIQKLTAPLTDRAAFLEALLEVQGKASRAAIPRVQRLLDVVEEGEETHLVWDWVDGPTLREWVEAHHEKGSPAPFGFLLAIAKDLLFTLHALHGKGRPLAHGGIGARAVRLDRSGFPVLTRFGVCAALEQAGESGAWIAERHVRVEAPEGGLAPPVDVFGMGLTLYAVLAGASDFSVMPGELKERLEAGRPVDLALIREDVPAVILRTIERALASDLRERFETAAAMARSCELLLRSLPESTDAPALAKEIERTLPRNAPPPAPPNKARAERSAPPAPPPSGRPKGLKQESTDQINLEELGTLQIDDDASE